MGAELGAGGPVTGIIATSMFRRIGQWSGACADGQAGAAGLPTRPPRWLSTRLLLRVGPGRSCAAITRPLATHTSRTPRGLDPWAKRLCADVIRMALFPLPFKRCRLL